MKTSSNRSTNCEQLNEKSGGASSFSGDGGRLCGGGVGGRRNGGGMMVYKNGDRYEGNWASGKRSGQGIMTNHAGDYYKGQWKNDTLHGKGVFVIAATGESYEGHFKARQDSAEDCCRLKAPYCTAMDWLLIPAYCFAIP